MKARVQQKLDQIFEYPFFQNVGNSLPSSVTPVKNWLSATTSCASNKWLNCRMMARNVLQRRIENLYASNPQAWHRFMEWEPLIQAIRPPILKFLNERLVGISISNELRIKLKNNIDTDLMFLCVEEEFNDLVEPLFFQPILEPWYSAGHFPCGWDGDEFPEEWDGVIRQGKLMVF